MDEELLPWLSTIPKTNGVVSTEVIQEGGIHCRVAWYCNILSEDADEIKEKITELITQEHADFVIIRKAIHKPHGMRGLGRKSATISHPNKFQMDFRYCTQLVTKRWFRINACTSANEGSCVLFGDIWNSDDVDELNELVKGGAPAGTPVNGVKAKSKKRIRRRM